MKNIHKIYTVLNVLCLLLSSVFVTIDSGNLVIYTATAGVMILLLFQHISRFIINLAYVLFIGGVATFLASNLSYVELSSIWVWAIGLLILLIWLNAPAAFLSGFLYGFWILLISYALIDFFDPTYLLSIDLTYLLNNTFFIFTEKYWMLLLIAYVVSVLPNFILKEASETPGFHNVTGLPLYLISLPGQLLIGFGIGIYRAIKNYIQAFQKHVHKQSYIEAEKNEQPAFENYWFKKAFFDMKSTYKSTIYQNKIAKQKYDYQASKLLQIYGYTLGAYSITVMKTASSCVRIIGYFILIICSFIHLLIIGIFLLPLYCYLTFFAISDRLYLRLNKVATVCPSCYHKSELPDYVCHNCKREHTDLRPSFFGIRKRKCLCGTQLPATSFNQRYELQAKCKNTECSVDLLTKEATPLCISIVGGPSSGKTSFVLSAVRELQEKVMPSRAWNMEFLKRTEETMFQQQLDSLSLGNFPNKTAETKPLALNLKFTNKKWAKSKLLYLYDSAGEVYRSSQELAGHKYYSYLDGYILIVDPFSMPDLFTKYSQEVSNTDLSSANPSETLLEDTYDLLMVHLAKNHGLKENKKVTVPLAIVINKVDVIELEEKIVAIQELEENTRRKTENERLNEQCKEFLKGVGYNRFVKMLESKFTNVQFFLSTSSPSHESIEEKSSKPITWIMAQKGYS